MYPWRPIEFFKPSDVIDYSYYTKMKNAVLYNHYIGPLLSKQIIFSREEEKAYNTKLAEVV